LRLLLERVEREPLRVVGVVRILLRRFALILGISLFLR
jgi:hypothetical protein